MKQADPCSKQSDTRFKRGGPRFEATRNAQVDFLNHNLEK